MTETELVLTMIEHIDQLSPKDMQVASRILSDAEGSTLDDDQIETLQAMVEPFL